MELTTRGRYAVMALVDLAKHAGDGSVPLSQIAERQKLSVDYLEQIFLKLRRAGLVESSRGRLGGYRLERAASRISIAEVMIAAEEETRMTRCLAGEAGGCLGEDRCLTHHLWKALGDHISSFLGGVTLQDVVNGAPLGQVERDQPRSELPAS